LGLTVGGGSLAQSLVVAVGGVAMNAQVPLATPDIRATTKSAPPSTTDPKSLAARTAESEAKGEARRAGRTHQALSTEPVARSLCLIWVHLTASLELRRPAARL